MITDLIINVIMGLPYLLLNGLSALDFELSLPTNFTTILTDLTCGVGYVLPVTKLLPIFGITIGLYVFRVVWALIIRIKSFIPTMGS